MTIEKNLGYFFFDKAILKRSLTTIDYALAQQDHYPDCEDQDAYSLLGDRLLQTILIERLIRLGYRSATDISYWLEQLISQENLARIGRILEVDRSLELSTVELQNLTEDDTQVLAKTLRAVIAGVYFDGGFRAASEVVDRLFQDAFRL